MYLFCHNKLLKTFFFHNLSNCLDALFSLPKLHVAKNGALAKIGASDKLEKIVKVNLGYFMCRYQVPILSI